MSAIEEKRPVACRQAEGMRESRYCSGRVAWEANWSATCFLMPEDAFRRIWQEAEGDVNIVSRRFVVSVSAVKARAKYLGLTKPGCAEAGR